MKKKIFFRCDASKEVGLGHVTRCISLAYILKSGFQICFLFRAPAIDSIRLLNEAFQFIELKEGDLGEEAIEVQGIVNADDILVIDGYQYSDDYFSSLRHNGIKLVLIDDFGKEYPEANVVINHALGLAQTHATSSTKYCLGEKYVMLRPPFLLKAKQTRVVAKVKNVFVCFGGADYHNVTLKVLQAFAEAKKNLRIHAVLATTFPFKIEVEEFVKQSGLNCRLYNNLEASEMAELMVNCEIAVAPTSGLSYEICAVGMGFVGGYYIDNQIGIHDGLLVRGCMLSVGNYSNFNNSSLLNLVNELLENNVMLNELIVAQRKVVDGESDKTILNVFSLL